MNAIYKANEHIKVLEESLLSISALLLENEDSLKIEVEIDSIRELESNLYNLFLNKDKLKRTLEELKV